MVLRGVRLRRISSNPEALAEGFDLTFEQAVAALEGLSHVDVEPDGFFAFSGQSDGNLWHVSGQLWEHRNRLWRVDLHGECPADELERVLACFGWPKSRLVFELVRAGVVVEERDFRRWAAARED